MSSPDMARLLLGLRAAGFGEPRLMLELSGQCIRVRLQGIARNRRIEDTGSVSLEDIRFAKFDVIASRLGMMEANLKRSAIP